MGVIERLSEQCAEAFRCRTPVLWVQTDSFEIIRAIVEKDEMVVRISGTAVGKYFQGRPFCELPLEKQMQGPPVNYKDQNLDDLLPQEPRGICPCAEWTCPHILTYHVTEKNLNEAALEYYIKNYFDPLCSKRDIYQNSVILLYGSSVCLSPALMNYTEVIPVDLPDREEIRELVEQSVAAFGEHIADNESHEYLTDITAEFSGFTQEEIQRTMRRILSRPINPGQSAMDDSERVFEIIQEQKKQRIMGSEILKLVYTPSHFQNDSDAFQGVGGLHNLKEWVRKRSSAVRKADYVRRTSGAASPKGILVCGIPGCGKSWAARAVAAAFGLPLLQMDMGSLMDKYQGESERNMRRAQELAEAMAPCVLWIDELSGASAGQSNDASFKRMFATMLNWMQENKKPCFLYATANDIGGLPKEFFRSGRFDALFAAFLPTCEECAEIIVAGMESAQENAQEVKQLFSPECSDLPFLSAIIDEEMAGNDIPRILIGSDISKLVNQALILYSAENNPYPIKKDDWETYLRRAFQEGSVYGDGSENIDSIAVSYIRMLKKGFQPANANAMFSQKDYLPGSPDKKFIRRMDDQSLRKTWPWKYDQAVYCLLADRMDQLAGEVEQLERSRLIGG